MSVNKEILKKEKEYLKLVKEILLQKIEEEEKNLNYITEDINSLKKFMWENASDYTDEELGMAFYDVDRSVDKTNKRIETLEKTKKIINSPYFAKILFKNTDEDDITKIYIGLSSVQKDSKFYVFDWRAPISSLFYNYEPGIAKYMSPGGEISGELLSKMQFKINDGEITRCFQSDINIDDEYLQEILSTSSNEKMKNIVSTIQRDQNEIIRNEKDKYLIVQGVAGSGKTSVALHRIAYLLYRDMKLNSNNVLIFSPNDIFSDYISNVLPELGEKNVMKTTISDFAHSFLKPCKKIEDYSEFLERVYSNTTIDNEINYKMSGECAKDIDEFFHKYIKNITFGNGISILGINISGAYIKNLFIRKNENLSLKEKIDEIIEHICLITRIPLKKNFNSIKKILINQSDLCFNCFDLYNQFLKSKNLKPLYNVKSKEISKINYEDISGIVYLYFKTNGYPNCQHIRQVVIDEAQDYTDFQLLLLKKIFKNASFTILGDINQTINPHYCYDSLGILKTIFHGARYIELNKTYRSSEEIISYSNKILGLSNVCAIRNSTSNPVEINDVDCDELKDKLIYDVESMTKQGFNKVAIITRDFKYAKKIHNIIDDKKHKFQLISSTTNEVNNNIVILPSYLSKGLEFDAVIVCNEKENNYKDNEEKLYYVVCTRAQHKLQIYNEPLKILKK